ncbi:probable RNA polymerase II nuclear localization protein SLC7A6OS [Solenopsis invicta]|uniref:probable RNA polymerase II nuclear localization protein SLC7A6OS n=1 Tax=Solenopsis invicta TaxID=13686 RepID=UPI000E3400F3|nr:probable RNA polymerase II nuclear localization protein SLC7A6OS [Solenopsis invicta]
MTTLLCVKRKSDSVPLDALVIACKRQKTGHTSSNSDTHLVAEFARTYADPEEGLLEYVTEVLPKVKTHKAGIKRVSNNDCPEDIPEKLSKCELKPNINLTDRYKITECSRTYTVQEDKSDQLMTIINVEDSWSTPSVKEDTETYAYDLYYASASNDDLIWLEKENIWVVQPEIPNDEHESEDDVDSEDSNAESHWKNDYPDGDPDNFLNHDSENCEEYDEFNDSDYDIYNDYGENRGYGYSNKVVCSDSESSSIDEESPIDTLSSDEEEKEEKA